MLPPQRQRTLTVISVVLTVVALAAFVALDPGMGGRVRALAGLDGGGAPDGDAPGTPYAFAQTEPVGGRPVAWDHCEPLEYVVNPAGAPASWPDLVDGAVARMEAGSGLDLVSLGETTDRDFSDRDALGSSPDPVLIGWADEDEVPGLAGDVAGLGGAVAVDDGRRWRYRTGSVMLDTEVFDRLAAEGLDDVAAAILLHELGHVVGLGHVDDPGELMDADGRSPRPRLGPGDRAGLDALAAVPCG